MTVYVAEINGRAIAAFNAENEIQAEVRGRSKPFRADLTVLENEGHPLWNGRDEIFIRKAFPEEEAQFDAILPRGLSDSPNFRNESSPASAGLFFFGGLSAA